MLDLSFSVMYLHAERFAAPVMGLINNRGIVSCI